MRSIEIAVIGTALSDPQLIQTTALEPEQFEDVLLGSMWKAMKEGAHDIYALASSFPEHDALLGELYGASSPSMFSKHVKKLQESSKKRFFKAALCNALEEIEKGADVDVIASNVQAAALKGEASDNYKSIRDIAVDVYNDLSNRGGDASDRYILSGYSSLDNVTNGIPRGELSVIAARAGRGKSAFLLNILRNISEDHVCLLNTLEMSSLSMGYRMYASEASVDLRLLNARKIQSEEGWRKLAGASGAIARLKLFIDDNPRMNIKQICTAARRFHIKQPIDLLAVDYIGLIQSDGRRKPRHEVIAEMTREMKLLAGELNIAVIMLCQLNRDAEGSKPTLAHLRESGAIE